VPARKGTKERPPIVEPKSLAHSMISPNIGVLRIAYFSGSLGIRFTRALDAAIKDLKDRGADRLIVDLRGNIGGSLGFARLASYMCPGKIPIGNSLTPKRLRSGYNRESLPQVPMPGNKIEAVMTLGRFAFRDKSVVLMTQGLGPQPPATGLTCRCGPSSDPSTSSSVTLRTFTPRFASRQKSPVVAPTVFPGGNARCVDSHCATRSKQPLPRSASRPERQNWTSWALSIFKNGPGSSLGIPGWC